MGERDGLCMHQDACLVHDDTVGLGGSCSVARVLLQERTILYGRQFIDESNHYLNFKGEVFVEIFNNHDKVWKFYTESLLWVSRTCDVGCAVKNILH